MAVLEAGLEHVRSSPSDHGRLELIVARPVPAQREVLSEAALDAESGLVGDGWRVRPSRRSVDGTPEPNRQVTIMNARAALLLAGDPARIPLAGDQLYVDLDLSPTNLPTGTRLVLGRAVVEITPEPHLGCQKFKDRFGDEAMRFVNGPVGRGLRLRGVNARVVVAGTVTVGDTVAKDRTFCAALGA